MKAMAGVDMPPQLATVVTAEDGITRCRWATETGRDLTAYHDREWGVPTHDEAFTTITKAQWDYPAILAAYDAVACSPEATARPGSRLSCREVYLAEPEAVGDDGLICDIAFPLGQNSGPVPA